LRWSTFCCVPPFPIHLHSMKCSINETLFWTLQVQSHKIANSMVQLFWTFPRRRIEWTVSWALYTQNIIFWVILPIRASSELFISSEKRLGTGPAKTLPSHSEASRGQDSNSTVGTLSLQ